MSLCCHCRFDKWIFEVINIVLDKNGGWSDCYKYKRIQLASNLFYEKYPFIDYLFYIFYDKYGELKVSCRKSFQRIKHHLKGLVPSKKSVINASLSLDIQEIKEFYDVLKLKIQKIQLVYTTIIFFLQEKHFDDEN
ncbi:hypothetical protein BpHYR1_015113 [Brachionus plicatilis]|uniref:Uncharacterized protein n=1 Tax=Brachionus plicatilis TaxID=10195 RepID=A0A3M7SA13_BRAPC|nr:hypothetical protein BpHYR1_015113 [Brachionus plicatilis]